MSKFKNHGKERGSITLFVLIAILFFIIIAYAIYVNTVNSVSEQNRQVKTIQKHYEQSSNEKEMEKEYNDLVNGNIHIALYFASSGEVYPIEQWTNQDLKVEITFPASVPEDERYYTIDGVKKKYEQEFIIGKNCTIISEYKDMSAKADITRIDKVKPTVTLNPNGGEVFVKTAGYYCSVCKATFKEEHYHCPAHSGYYSTTSGTCEERKTCSGRLRGNRITSYSGSSGCVVVGCKNPATKNVWMKCDECGQGWGIVTCDSHASYSTYYDVHGYGCSMGTNCGKTLINTSTEQSAEDGTIEVKVTAKDEGGSGLNTLQYAWSNSNTTRPTEQEWEPLTNEQTVSKKDCEEGSYYLWTRITDVAGNEAIEVSKEFSVKPSTENLIILTQNPKDWTNQDVTVKIEYDDRITGDKTITVTGTEGIDYEIKDETEVIIKTNNQTITVTVEDESGKEITKEITISNIDKIKPTVTLTPNGGNTVMPDSGEATIKTTLTAADEGGSGLNKLEYAWSTSKDEQPKEEEWKTFENGETVSKEDCKAGTYYLWTRVTDIAGNRADEIKVSQEFKVTKAENPMTVTNTTAKVGEVVDLSELVDNAKGTVSYQIKNQTTQGSTISGSTLTVGENAVDSDDNKVVVITVTDTGNGNYDGISKDITITVEKYTRTLEWDSVTPDSLEFGDNSKKAVAKVTGEGGIAGDITYQSSRTDYLLVDKTTGALTTVKADGSSEITAVMASTTTVKGATITKAITVKKSPTATVVQEEDKIYNGVNQIGVNGNHVTWKGTREAIDAGSYTVTATPEENYTWSDGSTTAKTITWKIEPKSVAITWGQTTSFVYNGQPQAPTASATSGISGETLNITRSTGTNVGSYTSTATLASVTGGRGKTSNYTLTNTTKAFTITNATITGSVTIKGENEYGSTLTAETVVNPGDAELTYQWYYNDDNSTTGGTPIEGANKKDYTIGDGLVGKHIYVVVTAKKPNYSDITFTDITDKNNNGSETVRKKTLQKPTIDGNYVYNGKEQTLNLNNYNGNDMTITGNTGIDAGDYTTTITLKDTENYQWSDGSSASITITWKINPKEIAVKWEDRTSFIFNGQPQAPTASAESGVSGETLNITRTMQTAIGSYTSTASLVSVTGGRGKISNYKLTNTTKDYRITDAVITGTVTIKGNNQYGSTLTAETVVEPSDATLSYQWYYNTSNSTSGGTAISGATGKTYTVGSGLVGKYIYVVVTAKKTNYANATFKDITDSTNNGSATVTKINVAKPTASGTYTYNGNTQSLNVSGYNSSTMNISGNTGKDAGSYTATVTLKDSSNYQWSDGTTSGVSLGWKINPKQVSVTWGRTTSFTYNGKAQAPTVVASSGVSGETLNITRTTKVNAGSYTSIASLSSVTGGQGKTSNYTLTNTQKAYTINKKAIQKTSEDYRGNYDGNSHTINLVVNEPKSGCTIYYSTSTKLTSSNYTTSGSTSKPSRTTGTTTVYWYIHSTNENYSDVSGSNTITIIDNIAPIVTLTPNGGNIPLLNPEGKEGYYCSICNNTFNVEHYHCPVHKDYYSNSPGKCGITGGTCTGTIGGTGSVAGYHSNIQKCFLCDNGCDYMVSWSCNVCGRVAVTSHYCAEHLYTDRTFGPCGAIIDINCTETLENTSTKMEKDAIKVKLFANDEGGSGLKTLQYAWSTSNTVEPTNWIGFTNGETIVNTNIVAGETYYLWTNVIDNAGNRAINVKISNPFSVGVISAKDIVGNEDFYYGKSVTNYSCEYNEAVYGWSILHADENNIYLIADNNIPKEYCPPGKEGTPLDDYYMIRLDNICQDYSGSSDIKDDEIKKLNKDYLITKGYTSKDDNMKAVAYLLDTDAWSVFQGDNAKYAIGGPTIELLLDSHNKKYGTNYKYEAKSKAGYTISEDAAINSNDTLLAYGGGMFIASPATIGNRIYMVGDTGTIHSRNIIDTGNIRPVVCLRSEVKLIQQSDGTLRIK